MLLAVRIKLFSATVTIHELLQFSGQIRMRLIPRSLAVDEGETASLMCRTSGKPVEHIHWFKDGQLLNMTEHINFAAVR